MISSLPEGFTGNGSDPDGYIEAQIPVPPELPVDEYDIMLTVTDSGGNKIAQPVAKMKVIGTPADASSRSNQ